MRFEDVRGHQDHCVLECEVMHFGLPVPACRGKLLPIMLTADGCLLPLLRVILFPYSTVLKITVANMLQKFVAFMNPELHRGNSAKLKQVPGNAIYNNPEPGFTGSVQFLYLEVLI